MNENQPEAPPSEWPVMPALSPAFGQLAELPLWSALETPQMRKLWKSTAESQYWSDLAERKRPTTLAHLSSEFGSGLRKMKIGWVCFPLEPNRVPEVQSITIMDAPSPWSMMLASLKLSHSRWFTYASGWLALVFSLLALLYRGTLYFGIALCSLTVYFFFWLWTSSFGLNESHYGVGLPDLDDPATRAAVLAFGYASPQSLLDNSYAAQLQELLPQLAVLLRNATLRHCAIESSRDFDEALGDGLRQVLVANLAIKGRTRFKENSDLMRHLEYSNEELAAMEKIAAVKRPQLPRAEKIWRA